jgi:type III secretion system low calcium response chaperone LcrH/SycD
MEYKTPLKDILEKIAELCGTEAPFPENLDRFLDDFIPNPFLKDDILQIAFGVTDEEMKELYHAGYLLYQKKNYKDALEHYRLLAILDPFRQKYWMGYAACLQLLKEYETALHGYAVAALLEEKDPICHYHAHECYLALNNKIEANNALSAAYELCDDRHLHLKEQIKIIKDKLCTLTSV